MASIPNNAVYIPSSTAADGRPVVQLQPFTATPPANFDDCVTFALYDEDVDPSVTELIFTGDKGGLDASSISSIIKLSAPNLEAIKGLNYLFFANNPNLEEASFLKLVYLDYWDIYATENTKLRVISFPKLTELRVRGSIYFGGCIALTDLDGFPSLLSVAGSIFLEGCTSLADISGFPLLSFIGGSVYIPGCTALENISGLTALQNIGGDFVATDSPLIEVAVNNVLALLVAANSGTWARTVHLIAGHAPTGQGLQDAATLVIRGSICRVNYSWPAFNWDSGGNDAGFTAFTGQYGVMASLAISSKSGTVHLTNSLVQGLHGYILIADNDHLLTFAMPSLQSAVEQINFNDDIVLQSIDLSGLKTCGNNLSFDVCPALTSINLSSLTRIGGNSFSCTANALPAAQINALLAVLVAAKQFDGVTVWAEGGVTIDFSLGTNAAPTGQGLADKATLISRGASVTTN